MDMLLLWIGRIGGLAGTVVALAAIVTRLSGHYWLVGVPAATLLQGGMALILVGCIAYLARLADGPQRIG